MITLLQRVTRASITVNDETLAAIGHGLLVLVAVKPQDNEAHARRLARRVLGYRLFSDAAGRMNQDVMQVGGQLLLVPQFTLAADTRRGLRPGFSTAAEPVHANRLFDTFVEQVRETLPDAATGRFGADMQVALVNDGPVTFWLET